MSRTTDSLLTRTAAFAEEWDGALWGVSGSGAGSAAVSAAFSAAGPTALHGDCGAALDVERMSDAGLLRMLESGFAAMRELGALLARSAGQVAARSRASLGPEGLAKKTGNANAPLLVAELGHVSLAEAVRLCRVGEATMPRVGLTGERMPPLYPKVAAALDAGMIPVDSAQWIVASLEQATPRANPADVAAGEGALVEFAADNPADLVRKLAISVRDRLDTDGIEPREAELVAFRGLRRSVRPNGMRRYELELDPLSAGFVDTAIDALVGHALRGPRFEAGDSPDGCSDTHEELADGRTIAQMGADAIVDLARHALSCTKGPGPLPHTEMIVRINLDALLSGLGEAQIEGIEQPISAGAARRLAAEARIIPMVLGGNSEVLDLGVGQRLFSHAQRLALGERDDGCGWAYCNRPASYTEAHHIKWWTKENGPTDLRNGVLLCSAHHHRVHRDGWKITIRDNVPWFTPPPSIDIDQKPRRGGRLPIPTPLSHAH